MKPSLSTPLSRYLTRRPDAAPAHLTEYLTEGAALVSAADLAALGGLLPELDAKVARITESDRFRRRLEALALYFRETTHEAPERREAAFALYYFLKGYDLVPDHVPHVGLLDDALLVEAAFNRNVHALRAHWAERGRTWPAGL
jgi:uncharacterized membrane protein YkvA (DUF1232 family)